MLMEARNISVYLNKRPILNNVSLCVAPGELVGVIGPNGAGKTTLLKSLAGLLPVESGQMIFQGKNFSDIAQRQRSRLLSYMAQGDSIYWPLKVEKLVGLGRLPYLGAWQSLSPEDEAIVERAMAVTEISHLRHRISTQLSGGERRLVMLARAIAVQPQLLLADEPVSGLDPRHQIQVMQLLRKMTREKKSVVMILHDLSLAARYCHKLCLMKDGEMLFMGPAQEVLTPQNLKEVYHIQAKYGHTNEGFFVVPWERIK